MSDGGPAFPWCGDLNDCPTINLGMTLRDYFAAKAIQGIAARHRVYDEAERKRGEYTAADMAVIAYAYADAMLKERDK
jgi:hypothetical protein